MLTTRPSRADLARFFEKVSIAPAGCWHWTGGRSSSGYGVFSADGLATSAHRVSFQWFVGPIGPGLQVDHLCFTRPCVNPTHLEAVSVIENARRALAHSGRAVVAPTLDQVERSPTHPGEIFREEFRGAAISQAEAARRLGWSTNRMNEFEVGKRGVTAENAVMLAALTGASPEFWMNLQVRYDLWHAIKEFGPAAKTVQRIEERSP